MLIRCDVTPELGLIDLHTCVLVGRFFGAKGYKIGYAVNKSGYEAARAYLDREAAIYRLPESEDEELERMCHLQRKHKHRVLFTNIRTASSRWFFRMHQRFHFTVVLDRGSNFLLYADLVVNPSLNAHQHRYNCSPEAKLLLGPRFYPCDPQAVVLDEEPPLDRVLVTVGNDLAVALPVLEAFAMFEDPPEIQVLCAQQAPLVQEVERLAQEHPHLRVSCPNWGQEPFAYHEYPLIITEASAMCLDFAHAGLCFVNVARVREQLEFAYMLEQVGVSPSVGWYASKQSEDIYNLLRQIMADPQRRMRLRQAGQQLVDGQGLARLGSFVPSEAIPDKPHPLMED